LFIVYGEDASDHCCRLVNIFAVLSLVFVRALISCAGERDVDPGLGGRFIT